MALELLEKEQAAIEDKIWEYSLTQLQPFYVKRREEIASIERFWPIAIDSCEQLDGYTDYQDQEALDSLLDLFVEWDAANRKDFTVEMRFGQSAYFPGQTIRKKIKWDAEKENYGAEPAEFKWLPGKALASDGNESFFDWFAYTDASDNDNSEISRLISDEIFPHALDFYRASQAEEDDEWDISDSDNAS